MKTQARKISRMKFLLEGKNVMAQPMSESKAQTKKNDEDSRRESSSPDRLLIGVGNLTGEESNSSPPVLFKGETLLPSSYQRIPERNGVDHRKSLVETVTVPATIPRRSSR